MQSEAKKPGILPLALILAGTALLYFPTLFYEFTYDDRFQILRNPRIDSWKYLGSYFLHNIWFHSSPQGAYYRPLFLVWLRLNDAVFGQWPAGWHATTVLLHLVAVWLVYELLRRTQDEPFVVVVGTAIFAVHPAHLESVAWISGLTDPLFAIPLLAALLCWLRYRNDRRRSWFVASLGWTLVALLAKETALILPALVFAYAFAMSRETALRSRVREASVEFAPFLFTASLFWVGRALALSSEPIWFGRSAGEILANIPHLLRFYGEHLTGAAPVGIYYDFVPIPWTRTAALLGVACIAALALGGWMIAKRSPKWLIAFAWMILPIAVATGAITVFYLNHDVVHDRYLYISTIGFGIAVAELLLKIRTGSLSAFGRPAAATIGASVVLSLLAFATLDQLPQWHDDLALFRRGIEVAPNNPVARKQYAHQLHLRNRGTEARKEYETARALNPLDFEPNLALAILAHENQQWEDAMLYCEQARKLALLSVVPCYRLESVSLMHMGKLADAETIMRKATSDWPREQRQHVLLGEILAQEGQREEARQEFLKELELGDSREAQTELARLQH